jgi:glycosyltransferase involved in cell wall biosynthesis
MTEDHRGFKNSNDVNYKIWIDLFEKDSEEPCESLAEDGPLLSFLLSAEDGAECAAASIASVLAQTDGNFELIVAAGDGAASSEVSEVLQKEFCDERIRYITGAGKNRADRINAALEAAGGQYFSVLQAGDLLAPHAVRDIRRALGADSGYAMLYTDEDRLKADGSGRYQPFFKPDWSPDTLRSLNYTGHLSVFRKELAVKAGGMDSRFAGAELYAFTLGFVENIRAEQIGHISAVLCHRSDRFAVPGRAAAEAERRAKAEVLCRKGPGVRTEQARESGQYNVIYEVEGNPLVSIIIPSKNNLAYLLPCIDSVMNKSTYRNFEIVLVDNGSTPEVKAEIDRFIQDKPVRYIYRPMDFNFSRMCNLGAENARGEYLLFLNDDIRIVQADWMERMLGQAQQAHTGAVGVKLVYPQSNQIQHTGVLNMKDGPAHALVIFSDAGEYYFGRNTLCYNYAAVTAACLMTSADKFHAVEGFNEEMTVAYNDTDLCFSLYEKGWYSVVRADVKLLHYESVSRGYDVNDMTKFFRMNQERSLLFARHPGMKDRDPFYSRNNSDYKVDFSCQNHDPENPCQEARCVDRAPGELQTFDIVLDTVDLGQTCVISGWTSTGDFEMDERGKFCLLLELAGGHVTEIPVHKFRRERIPGTVSANLGFLAEFDAGILIRRRAKIGMAARLGDRIIHCWTDRYADWGGFHYLRCMKAKANVLERIPERNIIYSLDRCRLEGGALMLRGWAFTPGELYNNEISLRVYMKTPTGVYYSNVNRQVRFDICRTYPEELNLLYSGFEVDCSMDRDAELKETELWLVQKNLRNGKVWKQRIEPEDK